MKSIAVYFESVGTMKAKAFSGAKLIVEKTFEQILCVAIMALIELMRH